MVPPSYEMFARQTLRDKQIASLKVSTNFLPLHYRTLCVMVLVDHVVHSAAHLTHPPNSGYP
jgi:hypothetical protein